MGFRISRKKQDGGLTRYQPLFLHGVGSRHWHQSKMQSANDMSKNIKSRDLIPHQLPPAAAETPEDGRARGIHNRLHVHVIGHPQYDFLYLPLFYPSLETPFSRPWSAST